MFLSELRIKNFRIYGSNGNAPALLLRFKKGLNLLVGENDSGKSCIIDAIKFVLYTQTYEWLNLDYEDFHVPKNSRNPSDRTDELSIECIFRGFNDNEAKTFLEWHGIENDEFFLRVFLKAKRNGTNVISDVKAGPDDEGTKLEGEARNYLRTTYLKPLRNAIEELTPRRGSRLSNILDKHDIFRDKEKHDLIEIMKTANSNILKYFEEGEGGKEILDVINNEYLKHFSSSNSPLKSIFDISRPELRPILEKLNLKLINNEVSEISTESGLGSHNLLFMAAELLLLKKKNFEGLKLALIEELEAHLHPQAQLRLIEYLQEESKKENIQMILTSHSTSLTSKIELENIIICKNSNAYPLGKDYTKLNHGDYKFLQKYLDDTKANLFFANSVIIVEGISENLILPSLAECIDLPLHVHGVSIVNVTSTALLRYSKIFLRKDGKDMNIKIACIIDRDIRPDVAAEINPKWKTEKNFGDSPEERIKNIQQKVSGKKQKYNEGLVKSFLSPCWTLEFDLALSCLRRELLLAVKFAICSNNCESELDKEKITKSIESTDKSFENWEAEKIDDMKIALNIVTPIFNNSVSKAVVAQYFSDNIRLRTKIDKEKLKKEIEEDQILKDYLVGAIKYVTS